MSAPVTVAREHDIPERIRALDVLPSDYIDLFVAHVPDAPSLPAEQWARGTMEGSSAVGRFMAWRVLCNLELSPQDDPDYIAGWRIAEKTDAWVRGEASSWFMKANVIIGVEDDAIVFATLVRYTKPIGRVIWGAVSAVHRRVAPGFLRGGVVRVVRGR